MKKNLVSQLYMLRYNNFRVDTKGTFSRNIYNIYNTHLL
jgi:hypothetical protein